MTVVTVCDRCGARLDEPDQTAVLTTATARYDLCDKCWLAFEQFMGLHDKPSDPGLLRVSR